MGQEPEAEIDLEPVAVAQKVNAPPGSAAVTYGVPAPPGSSSVAIPAGNASSNIPIWQQEKQGAKCCGCCCDYRRAVIIIAVISLCFSTINVIGFVAVASMSPSTAGINDDVVLDILDDSYTVQAIIAAIDIAASICALVGALKFNIWLVSVKVVWYIAGFVGNTIISIQNADEVDAALDEVDAALDDGEAAVDDFNYSPFPGIAIAAVFTALFMYPHIGFIFEVRKGIMSRETYPREEYSCCCISRPTGRY